MNIVKISKITYSEHLNMKKLFMKILIVESAYLVVWSVSPSASASDYVPWFTELVSMSEILLFPVRLLFTVSLW